MKNPKSSEYGGRNRPGLALPAHPVKLVKVQHRIRALNLTGDETGRLGPDPTKSFWHGGDKIEGQKLAARILAKQALDQAIMEMW